MASRPRYLELSLDFPPSPRFGMGVHVGNLAGHLGALGRDVTVATGPSRARHADRIETGKVTVVRHEPPDPSADPVLAELAAAGQLWCAIQQLPHQPDLVHNHDVMTVPLACLVAEKLHVPLITSIHVVDAAFDSAQGISRPFTYHRHLMKALETYGLSRSDLLVVPNEHVASLLRAHYTIDDSALAVLPLPTPETVPHKKSYTAGRPFRLVTVGRLISYKGIPALLEAMDLLPAQDFELTLIGDGPLYEEITANTRRGNVTFAGPLEHSDVLTRYRAADAVVLPSVLETHSLTLHEAMKAGVPIIAADIEPMRSMLTDGTDAVLLPADTTSLGTTLRPDDLAKAILELSASPTLRETLGINARARAARMPTPEQYATRFDELCRQRLHESSIRPNRLI